MPKETAGLELRLELLNACMSEFSKLAGENWVGNHLHLVGVMAWRLLVSAKKNQHVTVKTLSAEVSPYTSEATAIRVIKKMEEGGLISTSASKSDKRNVIIKPTPKIEEIGAKITKSQDNILRRHGYEKAERPA